MNEIYFVATVTITKNGKVYKSEKSGSNGKSGIIYSQNTYIYLMYHFIYCYNTGVLFHTPRARLRVTMYVTYLSSHGGATTVIITRVFCFIHLMPAYELPRM